MRLVDTHCHIHSEDYPLPIAGVDAHSREAGVEDIICVGVDAADSERAVRFVADQPHRWASVGQHPHEAKYGCEPLEKIRALVEADKQASSSSSQAAGEAGAVPDTASGSVSFPHSPKGEVRIPTVTQHRKQGNSTEKGEHRRKILAIGECGLDYFYGHSSKKDQERTVRYQIELALEYGLPLIFHVRQAFEDFWPIFDSYKGVRGVLHSFTDNAANLSKAVSRDLYIGVNGIMTFTKNPDQIEVARQIPLNRLVLETDAPFLTPVPLRGKVNEPAHVLLVAKFLGDLRQLSLQEVAQHTTANARQLFSF